MAIEKRGGSTRLTLRARNFPRLALTVTTDDPATLAAYQAVLQELVHYGRTDIAEALKVGVLSLPTLVHHVGGVPSRLAILTPSALGIAGAATAAATPTSVVLTVGDLVAKFAAVPTGKNEKPLAADTIQRYLDSYTVFLRWLGHGNEAVGGQEPATVLWDGAVLATFAAARVDPLVGPTLRRARGAAAAVPVTRATVIRDLKALAILRQVGVLHWPTHFGALAAPKGMTTREGVPLPTLLEPGDWDAIVGYCLAQEARVAALDSRRAERDWRQFLVQLHVLRWAGPRLGEMVTMTWQQLRRLDEETPMLLLLGHATDGPEAYRAVEAAAPLVAVLRDWRARCQTAGRPTTGDASVWQGAQGEPAGPITPEMAKNRAKVVQKAWGVVQAALAEDRSHLLEHTLHDFRHDCAVGWARAGATIQAIQHGLGHANFEVTMRYAQYRPPHDDYVRVATLMAEKGLTLSEARIAADPEGARALLARLEAEGVIPAASALSGGGHRDEPLPPASSGAAVARPVLGGPAAVPRRVGRRPGGVRPPIFRD